MTRRSAIASIALAGIFILVAWLGMSVHAPMEIPSLLWAPSGIALAFALIYGPVTALGILVGCFASVVMRGHVAWVAATIASVNALETLVAYYVLRHYDFHLALDRLRDVVALVVTAFVVSVASASLTTALVFQFVPHRDGSLEMWWRWCWGHISGDLIVTPLIVTWARAPSIAQYSRPALVEMLVLALGVVVVVTGVLTSWLPGSRMPHYLFPLLIWSALRFGPRGAATTNAVITCFAVLGIMYQRGPFGELADFQSFVSISAIATLALGAMRVEVIRAFRRKAAIQSAALDAIVTFDSRDRICEFNPAAERLFGVPEAFALGRNIKHLFVPSERYLESGESVAAFLREHAEEIVGKRVRYTAKRFDGTEFPAEVAISRVPLEDEDFFTGFVHDITAEHRAEEHRRETRRMLEHEVEERTGELRRKEELLRDTQELAHLGSFDFELATGALAWSDEMFRIYGQDPKSFVPNYPAFLGAVHPEDRAEVTEVLERTIAAGTPFIVEERIVRPDGSVRVLLSQAKVMHSSDGRGSHMMGCCQDITERKLSDAERYRLVDLVESSADAMLLLSLDGTIETWNPAAEKMFGYTAAEVVGHHADMLVPPGLASRLDRMVAAVGARERLETYELVHQRKDGSTFDGSGTMSSIVDHRGHVIGVSKVLRDTTEQKRARDQLRDSLREKEVLLREIHHRVKNNLQVISSLLNLQVASVPSEVARKGLIESQSRIQSMALLHQLLYQSKDLARIELGDYLRALLSYLATTYDALDRSIRCVVEAPSVLLDLDRAIPCGLIVNELVTNSLRHAFPSGRGGHITVEVTEVEVDRLRLEVQDDGVGIPADITPETSPSFGLQIARSLTQQLDGIVQIFRTGGTQIRVEFPIGNTRDQTSGADAQRPAAATG
ncbi:MAG: PAS domain S-box protein [Kofleriaceae bacterium]|nr:PAS domain S-box protein [Kofleriaceae bacterium]